MHHGQCDHVAPPRQNIVLLEDPDLFAYNEPEPTQFARNTSRYTSATTSSHPSQPSSQYYQNLTPDPSKPPAPPSSVGTGASGYGAFRAGGPVNLFSRTYISFLINWLLIGFFNGAMPALTYPLFQVYLHLQAYQGNAVLALIDFAWNFKFIFSFLTDCVPMNRYRRKPYLYIGWFVLTACLMGFTFRPQVEPYMRDGVVVNNDAEWQGPRHVIPLIVMSFARILVIVASEGMMVEFAHREGAMDRGETQAIIMMARGVGQVLGILLVAFGANSEEFGGTFNSSLSLRAMFGIWIAFAFLGLVTTRFIPEDQVPSSSQPFTSQLHRVWRIVQQRVVWQVMVLGFFLNAVLTLNYGEKNTLYQMRLTEHTLGLNILDAIKVVGSVIAAFVIYRFMLNANWRKIVVWSLVAVTVVGTPIDSITIFDALPSVALFYIKDFLVSIPTALIVFMREFVIVEITSPGYEAVTFGFITTVHYLGKPLAMMVTNLFAMDRQEVQNDTSEVRWHLAVELWIVIAVRLVVILAVLKLLPRDKRHALERKLLGNPNMVVPILIFLCVVAVFCAVVSSSFLAVIKNTSCLKFAGGSGCT